MKKIPIVSVIGLFVPVLLAVQSASADTVADLKQAEELYKARQYVQAEQAYLKVASEADPNKPAEREAAFTARKKLPLVYLATDRLPQAKDAVQQLLGKHAGYEFLPHAIHEIVEGAKPLYKLAQVRQVYQDAVTARPNDPQVIWLKMGVAIASVHQTDDPATDAVLQDITTQHGTDARAAQVLNQIAWACRNIKQYDKGLTVYQYVIEHSTDKTEVAFAQHGIVICYQGLGNPQEADAALEVLLQKFGKEEKASKMLLWAGHGYNDTGEAERARKVFELVVQHYPATPEAIEAQTSLAIANVLAGDRERIEPTIQTLLTQFPANEAKALGLHNVANTIVWKYVAYAGRGPQRQDLFESYNKCLLAIANYTLANWPNTDWAMWAQRDLATVAIDRGDEATAETAISRLTADYAERADTAAALDFLGDYCLALRKHDRAEAVYQYLVKKYPDYELAPLTKAELGRVELRQGNDPNAEAIFEDIMTRYANHPKLAEAVNFIGEAYYEQSFRPGYRNSSRDNSLSDAARGYVLKATEKWYLIVDRMMESTSVTPLACYSLARACLDLGECDVARQYCSRLIDRWPDSDYVRKAHFIALKAYKQQIAAGTITEAEGGAAIHHISSTLLGIAPTPPPAQGIRKAQR